MQKLLVNTELPNLQKIEDLNPNDYKIIGMMWKESDGFGSVNYELDLDEEYDYTDFVESKLYDEIFEKANRKQSRCNHCNKMIQYIMIGLNTINGTVNVFGHKCTSNISVYQGMSFESVQKRSLASFVKEKNEAKREAFLEDHAGLREALEVKNELIQNIRHNFFTYFKLSDKQIELVFKMADKQKEWVEKTEQRESEAIDVPDARVVVQLFKIISMKAVVDFNYQKTNIKTVLEHTKDKYRVYGNLPSGTTMTRYENGDLKVGDNILISATLTPSSDNKKFGFFKRAVGQNL